MPAATAPGTPVAPAGSAVGGGSSSWVAQPGPLSIGVPNLSVDNFRIPPFLLPIYRAAGTRYGVGWEVLAAINEIETDYGRNLNVSSAGAVGWMQFMPSTWETYGVDANRDGVKDPNNPVDAIFAAGRYLRAAGAHDDLRRAIFAYNHADWYVDSVLSRARTISGLPGALVDSLTGLTQGRMPVTARTTHAGRVTGGRRGEVRISARPGAPAVAVTDGTILRVGRTPRLGRFVELQDTYGNTYTYARLTAVGNAHRSPRRRHNAAGGRRELKRLHRGTHVAAGAVLGRVGSPKSSRTAHLLFEIRPAGHAAPRIDPRPILAGWKLLDSTAMYRVPGDRRSVGQPGDGRVLLMGKGALASRVLSDPRIQIYDCGRQDIRAGEIDRRVLATLEFLANSGFGPTVASLKCGHSLMTSSGNVSEHSTGTAVDIAAINGTPIVGHQGAGSITETVVRRLLTLQGAMKPHQIITLMQFPGTDNTFAMADHDDHIHVGWRPGPGTSTSTSGGGQVGVQLDPKQWSRLVQRLGEIKSPKVTSVPSRYAVKVRNSG